MKFKKMKLVYYGNDVAGAIANLNTKGWALIKWELCWKKKDVCKLTFLKRIK